MTRKDRTFECPRRILPRLYAGGPSRLAALMMVSVPALAGTACIQWRTPFTHSPDVWARASIIRCQSGAMPWNGKPRPIMPVTMEEGLRSVEALTQFPIIST